MKTRMTVAALIFVAHQAASARPAQYICAGDDGSDLSITVDIGKRTATLTGEDVDKAYPFVSARTDILPYQYVFGLQGECSIRFTAYHDGKTGMALFGCDARKYPRGLHLNVECTRVN